MLDFVLTTLNWVIITMGMGNLGVGILGFIQNSEIWGEAVLGEKVRRGKFFFLFFDFLLNKLTGLGECGSWVWSRFKKGSGLVLVLGFWAWIGLRVFRI